MYFAVDWPAGLDVVKIIFWKISLKRIDESFRDDPLYSFDHFLTFDDL